MIKLQNISKTYGKKHKAVDDLSLEIESGQIIGFIGPNGAGKTTTIKMMTGILEADEGSISINDYDIKTDTIKAKQSFGFVSDNPNSFLKLKGIEYLNFMADIYEVNHEDRQRRIEHYTKLLKIDNVLQQKIASYSHGMRQKIMVVASLLHDPYLLILDEPLTGLDPQSAFTLKELMKERAQKGKVVFFSTHVLEVAEKLCDEIAIINHGQIVYKGTLESLKQEHSNLSLEEIFLEVTA